jgi:hypothetical protein
MLNNYIPSYDFNLFTIPWISPLQAQEYGAETTFRANTPIEYVDYSLNQLQRILNPITEPLAFFQTPQGRDLPLGQNPQGSAEYEKEVQKAREEFEKSVNIFDVLRGRTVRSGEGTGPIVGSKETKSIDDAGIEKSTVSEQIKEAFAALPPGSGIFLIGIIVIVLLFLFVRK